MLELSRADAADAAALTQLVRAGKAHWGYPAEWLGAWRDELAITPERIAAWHVRKAPWEGLLVGVYVLARHDGDWWLEHLYLAPDRIGQGLGRELFRRAMAEAADLGASRVRIEADPNAESFYLRMGARRDG